MTRGLFGTYEGDIDGDSRKQDYEGVVAFDLNFNNVMFCFIVLSVGVTLSLIIASAEFLKDKLFKKITQRSSHTDTAFWRTLNMGPGSTSMLDGRRSR